MPDQPENWLTYAEAGQLLGISSEAARQMARRRKWPRRTPNKYGALAEVLVPLDAVLDRPRMASNGVHGGANGVQSGLDPGTGEPRSFDIERPDTTPDVLRTVQETVELLLTPLREQLTIANQRAERAEHRAEAERHRADRERDRADVAERRIVDLERPPPAPEQPRSSTWRRFWRRRPA